MVHDERDNQLYNTVAIGDQLWFKENLRFETPTESYIYDDDPANLQTLGRLYTADAAEIACPQGWRLPSDDDFKTLELFLGMDPVEVDLTNFHRGSAELIAYKIMSTENWTTSTGHTNETGFSWFGAGYGIINSGTAIYGEKGIVTFMWTSTPAGPDANFMRATQGGDRGLVRADHNPYNLSGVNDLLSVRCMRDL